MLNKVHKALRWSFSCVLLLGVFFISILFLSSSVNAEVGINQQMNFQGRLFNAQGATVPDGYYNLEFKIYQDGDGQSVGNVDGTLKWTEAHLNVNSQGVLVKNGYLSVQLGSINPFGTNVDWNQDTIWLSMNIGGINASCTPFSSCNPDGEMVPMKRLSSTPFSLNSQLLNGLSSSQFLQLAQGVQTDTSTNTTSIFINKIGTGNLIELQSSGSDVYTISGSGDITFGNNVNHTISVTTATNDTAGKSLTVSGGDGGTGVGSLAGGNLILQGGAGGGTDSNGGDISINAGIKSGTGSNGSIYIGNNIASTIQIGNSNLTSGTQEINIGNNNSSGGTTNLTLGSGGTATAGSTTLQGKDSVSISTNGTTRLTFDNTNSVYFGNGVTATTPNNFTLSGTGSTTTAVAGGTLTVQGGNATVGDANGGNLVISGGTGYGSGANGLVVMTTPTFSTVSNDNNCYTGGSLVSSSCTVSMSSVDESSAIIIGFNTSNQTATLPDPTINTPGRIIYLTAAYGSNDFNISVNGGGVGNTIAMRQNTTATMIWSGTDWTAAGASSSTTLQSAYDNTMQSAGGAELIVSHTSTTDGLTIRDSSINPVDGNLLSVQTSSAAGLLSVNSNVTEYSSDSGAEVAGSSENNFPSNTWSAIGGSTVSRYTTYGNYIATGQASVSVSTSTSANSGVKNTMDSALTANTTYNVSFTSRLSSGTFTDLNVYYSADGTTATAECTSSKAVNTSIWTKVNCTFTAPASGISSSNAIFIRQTASGTARVFYVDNLSVTIAADYNYATDGSVNDDTNFSTNWTAVSSASVSRSTTVGYDASDSARVVTTGANQGVRNKLSVNPLPSTLYRVTAYASSSSSFDNFTIRYSRDGGTNFVSCVDYNTQTLATTVSDFAKITCYITTDSTASTNPYIYFTQTDATARTFHVDAFSMTLSSSSVPNVQIGSGINGGPVTLLTLDRSASAPIASDNDALLGSMYYDTTLGKLQCYEADGWGACGSSPDNVITISPEYTNAVMHGTGVGTMTSDICSDTLNINDGSSSQPTICGANETYNFYKWTSPQASAQTYGIFVTYQLPNTFKEFASGQTSIMGRTDSSNATVEYQIYRNDSATGLSACGSPISVSTGSQSAWQIGVASGAADPSTCGFTAGNSIVFKINMTASQNANVYIGNLNFIFSNR
ncbi:MAG TPA: carbohydrate binding domain-containing protein [Candidatus Saccharibacteria bacterium]|nr:carbohydrate binding domain-containing protein [Candidatus Saccharibacteria bacterium]